MDVLIPTYGRATRAQQHTLRQLLENVGSPPTLVVQHRERDLYDWYKSGHVYVLPEHITTVAPTRDHIIHEMVGNRNVVLMDDDLQFAVRRSDDRTKFRQPEGLDLSNMIRDIDRMLLIYPMVGIGAREGGNRVTAPLVNNTRIMRVLAFDRQYLRGKNIRFTPMAVMEDFHVNLQVLRSGADTCVLNDWVSNQAGGSNAPGGCSVHRTSEVQTAAAHMLAEKHPGFVRVVEKTTKGAWGGGTRTDVVVSWKKARASA